MVFARGSAFDRRAALSATIPANDSPRVRVSISEDAGATFGVPVDASADIPVGPVDVVLAWTEPGQPSRIRVAVAKVRG